MGAWTNRVFQILHTETGVLGRLTDTNGIFIFRWRMYYDETTYEQFDVPVGVIKHFETFTALCRQFDTPEDATQWYLKKININSNVS